MRDRRHPLRWLALAIGLPAFGLTIALSKAVAHLGPAAIPLWIVTGVAGVLVLNGPVGKALAERLRTGGREAEPAPATDPAVFDELDELRGRVHELEERLDFAERLLARPARADAPARPAPDR